MMAAEGGKATAGSVEYVADARATLKERCAVRSASGWLDSGAQVAALRCAATRKPWPCLLAPGVVSRTRPQALPPRTAALCFAVMEDPPRLAAALCA